MKKTYNVFSNTFSLIAKDYGTPENWEMDTDLSMMEFFAPHFNMIKKCGNEPGCYPNVTYKFTDGSPYINLDTTSRYAKVLLADGSSAAFALMSPNCTTSLLNICGLINVDINGFKGPNSLGRDLQGFWLTKQGIIPLGTPPDTVSPLEACAGSGNGSGGCAAWILIKENMDYLKHNVSWDD